MPVKYPTVDEVRDAFSNAIPCSHPLDEQLWDSLFRKLDTSFPVADRGISVLASNSRLLVRIEWIFTIDRLNTSSDHGLNVQSDELRERLLTLANGELCSFSVTAYSEEAKGGTTQVKCWTHGIIG